MHIFILYISLNYFFILNRGSFLKLLYNPLIVKSSFSITQ